MTAHASKKESSTLSALTNSRHPGARDGTVNSFGFRKVLGFESALTNGKQYLPRLIDGAYNLSMIGESRRSKAVLLNPPSPLRFENVTDP